MDVNNFIQFQEEVNHEAHDQVELDPNTLQHHDLGFCERFKCSVIAYLTRIQKKGMSCGWKWIKFMFAFSALIAALVCPIYGVYTAVVSLGSVVISCFVTLLTVDVVAYFTNVKTVTKAIIIAQYREASRINWRDVDTYTAIVCGFCDARNGKYIVPLLVSNIVTSCLKIDINRWNRIAFAVEAFKLTETKIIRDLYFYNKGWFEKQAQLGTAKVMPITIIGQDGLLKALGALIWQMYSTYTNTIARYRKLVTPGVRKANTPAPRDRRSEIETQVPTVSQAISQYECERQQAEIDRLSSQPPSMQVAKQYGDLCAAGPVNRVAHTGGSAGLGYQEHAISIQSASVIHDDVKRTVQLVESDVLIDDKGEVAAAGADITNLSASVVDNLGQASILLRDEASGDESTTFIADGSKLVREPLNGAIRVTMNKENANHAKYVPHTKGGRAGRRNRAKGERNLHRTAGGVTAYDISASQEDESKYDYYDEYHAKLVSSNETTSDISFKKNCFVELQVAHGDVIKQCSGFVTQCTRNELRTKPVYHIRSVKHILPECGECNDFVAIITIKVVHTGNTFKLSDYNTQIRNTVCSCCADGVGKDCIEILTDAPLNTGSIRVDKYIPSSKIFTASMEVNEKGIHERMISAASTAKRSNLDRDCGEILYTDLCTNKDHGSSGSLVFQYKNNLPVAVGIVQGSSQYAGIVHTRVLLLADLN